MFNKGYRYVAPKKAVNRERIQVFSNSDGFFDGLPPLLPHEMRGRQMRLSKKDKQQLDLKVYELKMAAMKEKMDRLRRQMDGAGEVSEDQGSELDNQG